MTEKAFVCPKCYGSLKLAENASAYICELCCQNYKIKKRIPDFRENDEYWNNVDRTKMHNLISQSMESGDWLKVAQEIIPEYCEHFSHFYRADCQFIWSINSDSVVLDAGSMWGGITIPVSQFCKEIHAVDKTIETLQFLKIRAEQMGIDNVKLAASSLKKLPFPDNYFDLVILNGVLEWVAFEQELILEKHWGKRRKKEIYHYPKKPREMQLDVLKELRRVLKPNGAISVAIENAIGYIYLMGCPDDHINLRFVSFLPRWMANLITKIKLNSEYRVYVYSPRGLVKLLGDAGFAKANLYGVFAHYIKPLKIIPYRLVGKYKKHFAPKGRYSRLFIKLIPRFLVGYLSPSILAMAKKQCADNIVTPRLVHLLCKAGIIAEQNIMQYDLVYYGGRQDDFMTANYLVVNRESGKERYFCKVCRSKIYTDVLSGEAKNLKDVRMLISNNMLLNSIPELIYYGNIDGITFLVTNFIKSESVKFNLNKVPNGRNLSRLDGAVLRSLDFLVLFQKETRVDAVTKSFLLTLFKKSLDDIQGKHMTKDEEVKLLCDMIGRIGQNGHDINLFRSATHGDYDFYDNIRFSGDNICLLDFEHYSTDGLPFIDLSALIFNPLIMNWERIGKNGGLSFSDYIEKYALKTHIRKWLRYYAAQSRISIELLKELPGIAVLEHRAREYPYYRNPHTFPLNSEDIFKDMLQLSI